MGYGDFNKKPDGDYFGTKEPWVRHMSSNVEILWSNCLDLVTGDDLTEGSPIGVDDEKQELGFNIYTVGCPRSAVCTFVMRHDPLTGKLFTRIERI